MALLTRGRIDPAGIVRNTLSAVRHVEPASRLAVAGPAM
jgi:hypothetical protein